MRIRRRRKYMSSKLIIIVLLLAFGMGIGYAAISTTLTIDGTSDIDSASWNVHFENVQVTSGSVTATTPVISNETSVSFSANLANPGDFYEFTVDVVNVGTLDAKLDGIGILPALTQEQQNYLYYTVTYLDGSDIFENDPLYSGTTKKLLIRCEYLIQTDTSLYPTEDTSFNFSVSLTYVQGHGSDRRIVYLPNADYYIGTPLPSIGTEYTTYDEAYNANPQHVMFKYDLTDRIINATFIVYKYNNIEYTLRGGGENFNNSFLTSPNSYYRKNKEVLSSLFDNNCSYDTEGAYICGDTTFSAGVSENGRVYYMDTDEYYIIDSSGRSYKSSTLD